jgi:hypothetical protein
VLTISSVPQHEANLDNGNTTIKYKGVLEQGD